MDIISCPNCGSLNIFQGKMGEGVLTGYTYKMVCKNCGYQGMPIIFDNEKDYKEFLKNCDLKKNKNNENINEGNHQKNISSVKLPVGIVIMCFLLILQAFFSIYIYYTLFTGTTLFIWIYYMSVFVFSAVILPYGLLKGKQWAWTLASILFAMSIPIGLVFLYYITRPKIKLFFKKI